MTKECRMTKLETRLIRHSDFAILSSFVIREFDISHRLLPAERLEGDEETEAKIV